MAQPLRTRVQERNSAPLQEFQITMNWNFAVYLLQLHNKIRTGVHGFDVKEQLVVDGRLASCFFARIRWTSRRVALFFLSSGFGNFCKERSGNVSVYRKFWMMFFRRFWKIYCSGFRKLEFERLLKFLFARVSKSYFSGGERFWKKFLKSYWKSASLGAAPIRIVGIKEGLHM